MNEQEAWALHDDIVAWGNSVQRRPNFHDYVNVYHDEETGDYVVMIEEPDEPTALFISRAQWDAVIAEVEAALPTQHSSMTYEEATALAQEMDDFYEVADPLNRTVEFAIIANEDGTYSVLAIDAQESRAVTRADFESWKARRDEAEGEPAPVEPPGYLDDMNSMDAMTSRVDMARFLQNALQSFIARERRQGRDVPVALETAVAILKEYSVNG